MRASGPGRDATMARRNGAQRLQFQNKTAPEGAVRLAGVVRRSRRALLLGTALQATVVLVLALPARAQVAPNAQPTGGVVVGGAASISRTPGTTTIDQSSQRAALNWQSFDVGSKQAVNFQQPNAAAVALNRVVGPNPSQIAGQINANGQVILENQDGITFLKGAQINTAGLVATAAGITNKNFMAGRMVFDQPAAPNAAVVNQGNITVRQAGIAALVAPQVENSGVIVAKLGRVVLAGASTATLDLYGDGLVSIDVNGEVKQIPVGPDGKPATALVTNTGTIIAAGGQVLLTARQAAGLVQNLVVAGGTIAAPTAGGQAGQIVLNGIGGSIVVAGALLARGNRAGEAGGQIEVAPSGGVSLAATARVDASGAAGGGTVAIGTDLARAAGGPAITPTVLSQNVTVARGARIAANATAKGNGGRVTVLASDSTVMDGAIAARGGPLGGDGGFAEVSGQTLGFDGAVDVGAPTGNLGTILFDPGTLDIVSGTIGSGSLDVKLNDDDGTIVFGQDSTISVDTVSVSAIEALTGNLLLQATTQLSVQAPITLTGDGQSLTLQSGDNLEILSGASITTEGNITLGAAVSGILGVNAAGSITVGADITTTTGTLALSAGTGGIALGDATLSAPVVDLSVLGTVGAGVSQAISGAIDAGVLQSSGGIVGTIALTGSNSIAAIGSLAVSSGDFALADAGAATGTLTVSGPLTAGNVTLAGAGTLAITGSIGVGGGTLALGAGAGGISEVGGTLVGGTLIGAGTVGGTVALTGSNTITTLGSFAVSGSDFTLTDSGGLIALGPVSAMDITLNAGSIDVTGGIVPTAQAFLGAAGAGGITID
ncbi:MAG: filamentous hemagglutinin N-terminal domain-containing protein, partial [Acetobacteraceae bacterium]